MRRDHFHLALPSDRMEDPTKPSSSSGESDGTATPRRISSEKGTLPWMHPTHAHININGQKLEWSSRDHRKGRHPVESGARRKIVNFLRLEWWNVSWWVAFWFTLGSAVWVVNGFLVFLPLLNEMGDNLEAQGWTAFVGGTLFEIGGYMMVLESLNRKHEICFGDAVRGALSQCTHHFHNRVKFRDPDEPKVHVQEWIWYGARWHEIGFIASAIQFSAATVFWISTVTGIPGVIDTNNVALVNGIYWTPQIIGGSGFIISSLMFLLETQPAWWHIRPFRSLGWWVGFWNLVGAVGFTLCGALGIPQSDSGAVYQSSLATFWGSWAFLIGSVAQWVETLNR